MMPPQWGLVPIGVMISLFGTEPWGVLNPGRGKTEPTDDDGVMEGVVYHESGIMDELWQRGEAFGKLVSEPVPILRFNFSDSAVG